MTAKTKMETATNVETSAVTIDTPELSSTSGGNTESRGETSVAEDMLTSWKNVLECRRVSRYLGLLIPSSKILETPPKEIPSANPSNRMVTAINLFAASDSSR